MKVHSAHSGDSVAIAMAVLLVGPGHSSHLEYEL